MKILQVINRYLHAGGEENSVARIARHQARIDVLPRNRRISARRRRRRSAPHPEPPENRTASSRRRPSASAGRSAPISELDLFSQHRSSSLDDAARRVFVDRRVRASKLTANNRLRTLRDEPVRRIAPFRKLTLTLACLFQQLTVVAGPERPEKPIRQSPPLGSKLFQAAGRTRPSPDLA